LDVVITRSNLIKLATERVLSLCPDLPMRAALIKAACFLEFESPYEPPRRIPISETGYRTLFVDTADIKAAKSPQDFARDAALAILRSERDSDAEDHGQLSLF
jgi:hypothetical protein